MLKNLSLRNLAGRAYTTDNAASVFARRKAMFMRQWMTPMAIPATLICGAGCVAICVASYHQLRYNNTIAIDTSRPHQFFDEESPKLMGESVMAKYSGTNLFIDRETGKAVDNVQHLQLVNSPIGRPV